MADETHASPFDHDFDAIEAAVMETARGRWFLAEFARRNRAAETDKLFDAIQRLERSADEIPPAAVPAAVPVATPVPAEEEVKARRAADGAALDAARAQAQALRTDLTAILDGVAGANAAMLAVAPATPGHLVAPDPKGIDRLVDNPGDASATILAAAETIQEQVWMLREGGAAPRLCDAIDRGATQIFAACAFGELAGRRAVAVVKAMAGLAERAREIAARQDSAPDAAAMTPTRGEPDAERANDLVFSPSPQAHGLSPRSLPVPRGSSRPTITGTPGTARPAPDRPPRPATLADIDALTAREKLRLFT